MPPERNAFLKELSIRFTPPGLFNDPFDSLPSFDGFDANLIDEKLDKVGLDLAFQYALEDTSESEALKKLAFIGLANKIQRQDYLSNPGKLESRFQKIHRKNMNRDIGILCLSKNPQSILMWSHYSSEHKGFAVGFESDDKFFQHSPNEPEDIGVLRRVNYTTRRPHVNVQKINKGGPVPDVFFTKNQEWSYEEEWRIIRFLTNADKILSKNIHLFNVPPSAVREVIFGCNTEPKTIKNLRASFTDNPSLKHVSFFNATISRAQYEMDIIPFVASNK